MIYVKKKAAKLTSDMYSCTITVNTIRFWLTVWSTRWYWCCVCLWVSAIIVANGHNVCIEYMNRIQRKRFQNLRYWTLRTNDPPANMSPSQLFREFRKRQKFYLSLRRNCIPISKRKRTAHKNKKAWKDIRNYLRICYERKLFRVHPLR